MTGRARWAAAGGVCGLAWSAGLRGWMVEIMPDESRFTWMTYLYILVPGVVLGVLLGLAAHDRAAGRVPGRLLVPAPLVLAVGLLDPRLLWWFAQTGEGGGALLVALSAVAGGFALARRRWSPGRVAAAAVALLGIGGMGALALISAPPTSARAAWVALLGASHLAVLCLAAALTHPPSGRRPGAASSAATGGLCGLAWATALVSLMVTLGSSGPSVAWVLLAGVVLPGAVTGALLGWAGFRRWGEGRRATPALAVGPLAMAAICVGAVVTAPAAGLDRLSDSDAHAAWAALLNGSLLATLGLAAVLAFRRVPAALPPVGEEPDAQLGLRALELRHL
jgi:hypothetical protein